MITNNQVKHIANLAKLEITDKESEKFAKELSKIVDYIEELKTVDTDGVSPISQVSGQENKMRHDVVVPWDQNEKLVALEQADLVTDGLVKVPKIL